ncbi:MAG: hypothetical protein U1F34_08850 [Gammaproteobacteria bacterium]
MYRVRLSSESVASLAIAIGLAFSGPTHAATVTWTAGNGFWENSANWDVGVPTASDLAVTKAGVVISSEANNTAKELQNNAQLNVAKNTLSVGGTIVNNQSNTSASVMTSAGGNAIADRLLNYGGVVVSTDANSLLTVGAAGFFNYGAGRVRADHGGAIHADGFDNEGQLDAIFGGDVKLNSLVNRTGATTEAQNVGSAISISGLVTNQVFASFVASDNGQLSAGALDNAGRTLATTGGDINLNSLNNLAGGNTEAQGPGSSITVVGPATNAAGARVAASGNANVSAGSIDNSGEFLALTGGDINANSLANHAGGTTEAQGAGSTITVTGAATNDVGGTLASTVGANLTTSSISNSGRLLALVGGKIDTNSLNNTVGAETRIDGTGSQVTISGNAANKGLVEISNTGLLAAGSYSQDAGITRLVNGTLLGTSGAQFNGGSLEGEGNVIGDTFITQNALIAPGLGFGDAGQINIAGTFNLDGTALYEIGGISSTAYDVINVTGNAVFGGTSKLQVSLFNSFAPSLHDKFDIVLFTAGLGGTFGNSVLPALNTGLSWQINYLADRVQLEVVATSAVPLPASLWLMVSALLGVVSVGRRRVQ